MLPIVEIRKQFDKHGGIMRTSELCATGLNSRQILRLVTSDVLSKVKVGFYQLTEQSVPDEVVIARLFPTAIIYLESALLYYAYTDRIPATWQLAVDKNISKPQFNIAYPPVTPYYIEGKYIQIGVYEFEVRRVKIRIYDKERTICDVLRYANKMDREVVNTAIQRYVKDKDRNIHRLMEYAQQLRVSEKVKTYVGVWL